MKRLISIVYKMGDKINRATLTLCLLVTSLFISPVSQSDDTVVLQLKWEHEFQFAGYYAALWQGYYKDEGLQVEIRSGFSENGKQINLRQQLESRKFDFAVATRELLFYKDQGLEPLIVAPIFQRSANTIFTLRDTPLNSIADLVGLRVAVSDSNFDSGGLASILKERGIDPGSVTFTKESPDISTLVAGKADAIVTYDVTGRYQANEDNVAINRLALSEFGFDFYGDTIITHRAFYQNQPDLVYKFLRATQKGWEYALKNRQAIAKQIVDELPRYRYQHKNPLAYNLMWAEYIDEYIAYPTIEIGHNNQQRWQRSIEILRNNGQLTKSWSADSLFIAKTDQASQDAVTLMFLFALILLVSVFIAIRFNQLAYVGWILPLFALGALQWSLERNLLNVRDKQQKIDISQQLNNVATRVASKIEENLSIVVALEAFISANPDMQQTEYESYAAPLFRREPLLISLGAAPNNVIRYIYPLKGNESALGLDYRKIPAQYKSVKRAMDTGNIIVSLPITLVQGNTAFLTRSAVYKSDGEYWGVVAAPLDANGLYRETGLFDLALEMDIAIRRHSPSGEISPVFFGEQKVFDDPSNVTIEVRVGEDHWDLAARVKPEDQRAPDELILSRLISGVILIVIWAFLFYRRRQLKSENFYLAQIRQNEQMSAEVGKIALIGGWSCDPGLNITHWNPNTSLALQFAPDFTPESMSDIVRKFDREQASLVSNAIAKASGGDEFDIECWYENNQGKKRWLRIIGHADVSYEPQDSLINSYPIIGAIQDISQVKKFSEIIERQALFDEVTGLVNRSYFKTQLKDSLQAAKRQNQRLAVLFIDLDKFKSINDNLGHKAGDLVLKEVGQRIESCLRDHDIAARYAGDEYTAIIKNLDHNYAASAVAKRMIQLISEPFEINGEQLFCGASIGISIYPDDTQSAEELISFADQAMYQVKNSGRNGWRYFTLDMQTVTQKKHKLLNRLMSAISNDALEVHYQPIIDLQTGVIAKSEALVRWYEGETQIPTIEFIELAEESGLINELDRYVLDKAIQFHKSLKEQGYPIELSINVSPRLFTARDRSLQKWLEVVTEAAQSIDITIEMTERLLTQDSEAAQKILSQLKAVGVNIAIDDFGTGYSSLGYLTKFPIDVIKIDRSFVNSMLSDETAKILTDAILSLTKQLRLDVVAEGIESQQELDYLTENQCHYGQGYFINHPLSPDKFIDVLQKSQDKKNRP